MKNKTNLNLEGQKQILLKLFKGKEKIFNYKEIENHCVKNNISFMMVKDLLNLLLDENKLETDKIGSSSYYWYLPNRIYDDKKKEFNVLSNNSKILKIELSNLKKNIQFNKYLRIEDEERKNNLVELGDLEKRKTEYLNILKDFENKDPEEYKKLLKGSKSLKDLINFWVDNIYSIEQWMANNRPDVNFEKMFPYVKELHLFE